MSTNILFQNNQELFELHLTVLGITQQSLDKDIDTIVEWIKSQPHLPEVPSRHCIGNVLKANKCAIEKTKSQFDLYYTMRTLRPDLFKESHPRNPEMQEFTKKCYLVSLPKQTKQGNTVTVIKALKGEAFTTKEYYIGLSHTINAAEIRLNEEVSIKDIVLIDCEFVTLSWLVNITPTFLQTLSLIFERLIPGRIEKIILVGFNGSLVQTLLKLLKRILTKKLSERLVVLDEYHELFDHVDKQVLPKDYGGDELSLDEINEVWKAKFVEYYPRFDELAKMRVKEELRPTPLNNDEILGYYGNFKQLDVD